MSIVGLVFDDFIDALTNLPTIILTVLKTITDFFFDMAKKGKPLFVSFGESAYDFFKIDSFEDLGQLCFLIFGIFAILMFIRLFLWFVG